MLDKTFDHKKIEEKYYDTWEAAGAFQCDPESSRPAFCIMMPPPNVTGSLHMGHAFQDTLMDILVRYKRMKGFDVLWQPGTDHASIAVHMILEKQLAEEETDRFKLGREEFMKKAWAWKKFSGDTITRQLRSLGVTPDWTRERFTMDEGLSKAVTKAFVQLYREKLIYRAESLVNWDPERQTVISDIEVEQREQKGHMWHLRYPVEGKTAEYITVATTRPETMLGDTAVAVHPEDERYKDLIGKSVCLPITGRMIPVIADEHADPEQGSGAVKITPAHDFNDFEVGKRHDLPMINVFDENAAIAPLEAIPEPYHGLDRFEAREKILSELEEMNLLAGKESIKHVVPYGDRSGVIIEPFLTKQWFCDAPTLAKPAAEAVRSGKTKFVPKQWENTYFSWVDNMLPWCISRQLWWGHRIPAWYGPDGEIFVEESEEQAKAAAKKHYGQDVELQADEDVLDTWFSSALWPFSTLGWPDETPALGKYYPTDVLVTAFDIIFFWVARMMMMGLHFMDEVPFSDVYMHALVRDEKGQKMSKSKGNVLDPLDLIDKYGADALRFTLTAMAAQGRDIRLSEDRIEGYRNFATKLWNAARYCEMNECRPDPAFDPAEVSALPNQWIISETARIKADIDCALAEYRFNEAAMGLYQFVWGTFCDWYLEFTKPLLQQDNEEAAEIRKTTGWVLDQILIMLNPFMPYITEELYAALGDREEGAQLITHPWPSYDENLKAPGATEDMDWLIRLISEIRSVRADMNVPAKAEIDLLIKDASKKTRKRAGNYSEIIQRMARIKSVEFTSEVPGGAIQAILDEAILILPVSDIIDLDQERARLNREMEKLEQNIGKIEKKLENKQFIANAPEDIVEEQHRRKQEAEKARDKLVQALKQLEVA